ncbi:hypothetical protein Slin14017_G112540 [Septoria linicola]|nr:hypothetical protein Slin14017_G112540 [Septoria linicola]
MRAPSAREQPHPRTNHGGASILEQSLQDPVNGAHHTASMTRADFWEDCRTSLQPASVLSGQTGGSGFSLRDMLQSGVQPPARPRLEPSPPDKRDPIMAELLNHAIAASLFVGFMMHLNPFVSQLDPDLHTMEWIRAKSAFLFTTTLMAASKSFNPALYSSLRDHAEMLLPDAFRRGTKSTEVVQAIPIMTYWKDPNDTRAFVNVGLAIRIAIELGWHEMESGSRFSSQHTETYTRELRNAERTWLVLFVYDRRFVTHQQWETGSNGLHSLAMQTGKPSMIENGPLIDSVDD